MTRSASHDQYERRLSQGEAKDGYVLVLKDRLPFFPPVGEAFDLDDGHDVVRAMVEAEPCTCRGPERPHEHFFIRRAGLTAGNRLLFQRRPNEPGYTLTAS